MWPAHVDSDEDSSTPNTLNTSNTSQRPRQTSSARDAASLLPTHTMPRYIQASHGPRSHVPLIPPYPFPRKLLGTKLYAPNLPQYPSITWLDMAIDFRLLTRRLAPRGPYFTLTSNHRPATSDQRPSAVTDARDRCLLLSDDSPPCGQSRLQHPATRLPRAWGVAGEGPPTGRTHRDERGECKACQQLSPPLFRPRSSRLR